MVKTYDNGNRKAMEVMLAADNPSKGNKKGITEIIQRVIEQDPTLDKPGIEDSVIQILEFLLTGQPKQKGDQDGLTKTVLDVISGTQFVYEYTYNNEDQLTSVYDPVTDKEYSYTYDIRGNLTSKQDYYGDYSYSWDYKNRLIELKKFTVDGSPLTDIKYSYDSKDRRISKTVIPVRESSTTYSYKYDGWAVMEETIQRGSATGDSATETIKYTYSGDSPIAITLGDSTYYYTKDGHGDVREVTDSEGNTLVKYSYDAWGSPTTVILSPQGEEPLGDPSSPTAPQDDVANLNPYRYTGYRYDTDTGLYYLRARYYDPVTGRFLSQDPIAAQNLYPYVNNNPINAIDPSGMLGWLVKGYTGSNQVYVLQDALKQLYNRADGYPKRWSTLNKAPLSGDFDDSTKEAVKTFQRIFMGKSYENGVVSFSTWNILLAENLAKYPYTGVSSPCRDNNGFRDGSRWDTGLPWRGGKHKFVGSDCYYSINWAGDIFSYNDQYNLAHSVCFYGEYNENRNNAAGIKLFNVTSRYCRWRGSKGGFPYIYSDYPQICSENLPIRRLIKWRRNSSEVWEDFNYQNELNWIKSHTNIWNLRRDYRDFI